MTDVIEKAAVNFVNFIKETLELDEVGQIRKEWRLRRSDEKFYDIHHHGYPSYPVRIGERIRFADGVIAQIVDYEKYLDPHDMYRYIHLRVVEFVGLKPIDECTFEEYLEEYAYQIKKLKETK